MYRLRTFLNIYFLILFFIPCGRIFSQNNYPNQRVSIEAIYGQKFLAHKTLDGRLNTLDQLTFGGNLTYAGIGVSERITVQRGTNFNHYANIYYAQVMPQPILINDSLSAMITGFNLGITLNGVDFFPKSRYFDIYMTIGFNTGRLKLYGNQYTEQKNPYFSPKLRIYPALTLGHFRLSIYGEYEFDVSKKNWRRLKSARPGQVTLSQTSNTGLTIFVSAGYVFGRSAKKPKSNIKT